MPDANPLFAFREWLAIDEAAQYLRSASRTDFAESDVLRLALDGHLDLCLNLPTAVVATYRVEGEPRERNERIEGLWDLVVSDGAGRLQIESQYHFQRRLPYLHVNGRSGAHVTRDGRRFRLPPDIGQWASRAVPEGSVIGVRIDVLDAFVRLRFPSPPEPEVLDGRERTTLMILIAALAEGLGLDSSKPSDVVKRIVHMTERIGVPLDGRTIEKYLEQTRETVERRSKK